MHSNFTRTLTFKFAHSRISISRSTLIIVVVCGSVLVCLLVFLLSHLFRRVFRLREFRPAPLPPVQPLAHHRELHLAQFVDRISNNTRTSVWYGHSHLSVPPMFGSVAGSRSDISLLHRDGSAASPPSPDASFGVMDRSETPVDATIASKSTTTMFDSPSAAQPVCLDTPSLPETPHSCSSLSLSHCTNITHRTSDSPLRSTSRSRLRSRPLSVVSTVSTNQTHRTSRAIRGIPHGPHSNVQIVLPQPLSSSVRPTMGGEGLHSRRHTIVDGVHFDQSSHRLSVVDQWASLPVRTSVSKERRSLSFGESTSPAVSQSNSQFSHARNASRSRSLSFIAADASTAQYRQAPPVPRIPSVYNHNSLSENGI